MNYQPVIEDLTKQIEKLTNARSALLSLAGQTKPPALNSGLGPRPSTGLGPRPGKSTITPAGREKLRRMMKARWAEKKRAAKKAAPKKSTAAPKAV